MNYAFTPSDFLHLLNQEREWFELLMKVCGHRCELAEGIETEVIELMLNTRAKQLRN